MNHTLKLTLCGAFAGLCNGAFGSGGGMIAVPVLLNMGLSPKKAHATAIAIVLPMTVVSIWKYLAFGRTDISTLAIVCAGGVAGACVGAMLIKRLPDRLIRYVFGVFMIITALRMVIS